MSELPPGLAAQRLGDVRQRERQTVLHRAAATAARQRAEHAGSLLSEVGKPGADAIADGPGEGLVPQQ